MKTHDQMGSGVDYNYTKKFCFVNLDDVIIINSNIWAYTYLFIFAMK